MTYLSANLRHSGILLALTDCFILVRRNLRRLTRNLDEVFQAVALPILLLLIFRYLFGGAIHTGQASYVNYVVAGVIVLSIAFNSSATAVAVANDINNGIIERFRVLPILSSAIIISHVIAAVLRNVISVILVIALGLCVGFRPSANFFDWLVVLGLLLVFITAISWIAALLGILANGVEGAAGYAMILVFLPYISSALVPTETMPTVLRSIADYQPFTFIVNAVRSLLISTPLGHTPLLALAWWSVILVAGAGLAHYAFIRRTSK